MHSPRKFRIGCIIVSLLFLCFPLLSTAVPPSTPENFRYEVYSDTAAELFWQRTTDLPTVGYEITKNGAVLGVYDALSYFDDTLMPGIVYTYTIAAIGFNDERSSIATVVLRTPQSADDIANLQQETSALESQIDSLQSFLNAGILAPVAQTGQTMTNSQLAGDDGDRQTGVNWPDPRFTVNVNVEDDVNHNRVCDGSELCNGTVTDNLTGLIWLQTASCFGAQSWLDAINDTNNLAGDGSSCGLNDGTQAGDWRLPNVKELLSLIDYSKAFPTPLLPTGHPFVDLVVSDRPLSSSSHWTSTPTGLDGDAVYRVSLGIGNISRVVVEAFAEHAWPVRGGR